MKIDESKKTENLNIRLTDEEKEKCQDLAHKFSKDSLVPFTTSDIVRIAIQKLHHEIFK